MPTHPTFRSWKPEEITRLIELSDSGATRLRACAALNRSANAVATKARELGKPLPGARKVRAGLRATGAING